jgi:hypothetical protein
MPTKNCEGYYDNTRRLIRPFLILDKDTVRRVEISYYSEKNELIMSKGVIFVSYPLMEGKFKNDVFPNKMPTKIKRFMLLFTGSS